MAARVRSQTNATRCTGGITCKLFAIDGFTAGTVTAGKVAALEHELGDDTVELGSCVAKAVLARGELAEVLGRAGHDLVVELEDDMADGLVIDFDLELERR